MNNKKVLIVIVLLFVIILAGAYVMYSKLGAEMTTDQLAVQQTPAPEVSGEEAKAEDYRAPDFTVYDADGNEVHLYDFAGKPVVLNFWASWCGNCQIEMPDFNDKYIEHGDEVQFLMINVADGKRETVEKAAEFIAEKGYSFPVFYDTTGNATITYAYSLPTTYFIDSEGNALARVAGIINAETLQKGIDLIK